MTSQSGYWQNRQPLQYLLFSDFLPFYDLTKILVNTFNMYSSRIRKIIYQVSLINCIIDHAYDDMFT